MSAGLEKSFENMTKYDDDARDAAEDNRVIILIAELLLGMGCITMFVKHRRKAQSRLIFEDVPLCVAACIASVQYRRTAGQSSLIGLCSPYAPDCFFFTMSTHHFFLPCPSARSSLVLNFVNTLVLREYCARRGAQDSTQFAIQVSASQKAVHARHHAVRPETCPSPDSQMASVIPILLEILNGASFTFYRPFVIAIIWGWIDAMRHESLLQRGCIICNVLAYSIHNSARMFESWPDRVCAALSICGACAVWLILASVGKNPRGIRRTEVQATRCLAVLWGRVSTERLVADALISAMLPTPIVHTLISTREGLGTNPCEGHTGDSNRRDGAPLASVDATSSGMEPSGVSAPLSSLLNTLEPCAAEGFATVIVLHFVDDIFELGPDGARELQLSDNELPEASQTQLPQASHNASPSRDDSRQTSLQQAVERRQKAAAQLFRSAFQHEICVVSAQFPDYVAATGAPVPGCRSGETVDNQQAGGDGASTPNGNANITQEESSGMPSEEEKHTRTKMTALTLAQHARRAMEFACDAVVIAQARQVHESRRATPARLGPR